ncbi:glycogen debranching protein [Gramella jeungdoensis]|uniref:Glycogen debranching protein n=1 Tax=Gramella jeungdoensis TaxID=708091 RepID=A0ABT0Z5Q6_9FLAO|nr:glycogen debranching protein [Gramella jeungdoensis]MCM8571069.1 glycogen debranching protein [Gramella jeungdoensis]
MKALSTLLILFLVANCFAQQQQPRISDLLVETPFIEGKEDYLDSPFVTAGNRIYIVGHQDGSFPEIGWHIKGEMGGVWNHPIKLFDGFEAETVFEQDTITLNKATSFVNYPIASKHDFNISGKNIEIERWQFVPDQEQSFAIQFVFKNNGSQTQDFEFNFKSFSDLRPTWLGERTNMIDSPDRSAYNENHDYWIIKDSINPWSAVYKADRKSDSYQIASSSYKGLGKGTLLTYKISIAPGESENITFFLAGSFNSVSESLKDLRYIQENLEKEIITKREKYEEIAKQTKLTVPDKKLQQTFEWLKYNSAWLVQEVPEIGTGITAGIPDYPWWFGVDSEYALKGYLAIGQMEPVYKTIRLLDSVSEAVNGNGRIIHEMSTNGAVFNKGNINETPQFASLIWEVYKWTGDREFLQDYFPTIQKGLQWLLEENDSDNNLFPDGFGMMEIHGLDSEMIDVAAYTQKGFDDASGIAKELGKNSLSMEYKSKANKLKEKINNEFWSEDFGSYADFIGTDKQALRLIDDAIVRADTLNKPWSVKELKRTRKYIEENPSKTSRPFVLHHNWVVNTPMEMNIADPEKAKIALKTAENYTNPFGVFVTGIDRDETAGTDEVSFKGSEVFSYTGAVMTLPTGVQAVAENNYGNPDKALDYLKRMTQSFSFAFPGSMYEVSPDYGMITQAWNIYGFAVPIVKQFFGIQPMAIDKKITIKPQFPSEWDHASLENVKIGDNQISVYHKITDGKLNLEIHQDKTDWEIEVILPEKNYDVTGGAVKASENKVRVFSSSPIFTIQELN